MEMYKQASQIGLRIQTNKGILSVEQLWQLNQTDLSNAIKSVKKVLKKTDDDELSFLEDDKVIDVENELRFNILKDVYITKQAELKALREASDIKKEEQRLLSLIKDKKESAEKELTIEQLEEKLANLKK